MTCIKHSTTYSKAYLTANESNDFTDLVNAGLPCTIDELENDLEEEEFLNLRSHPIHVLLAFICSERFLGADLNDYESAEWLQNVCCDEFICNIAYIIIRCGLYGEDWIGNGSGPYRIHFPCGNVPDRAYNSLLELVTFRSSSDYPFNILTSFP